MSISFLGKFSNTETVLVDGFLNVDIFKDEDGNDFYELVAIEEALVDTFFYQAFNLDGILESEGNDLSTFSPYDLVIIKVDDVDGNKCFPTWTEDKRLLWTYDIPTNTITKPTLTNDMLSDDVRTKRDGLLATQVDPLVTNPLRWAALSAGEQTIVTDYRQLLLDVPQQGTFPTSVTWPVVPALLQ